MSKSSTSSASATTSIFSGFSKEGRRRSRGRGAVSSGITEARWHSSDEPDITPPEAVFRPARTPGPQLLTTESYSVLELFRQFFSSTACQTIIQNSNVYAAEHQDTTRNMSLKDLYSYLSVVIYMGLVKVPQMSNYWSDPGCTNLAFLPLSCLAGNFRRISGALHLSDPKMDAENAKMKGIPAYDHLGKLKPVYQEIRDTCKTLINIPQ